MKKLALLMTTGVIAALAYAPHATAQTEISWWHALDAELGKKLESIAQGFNNSQSDYKIVTTYKGTYPETLTAAIAAFRANEQPAIVQVFEVGTGTMMAAKGAVKPVYELMTENASPGTRPRSWPRSSAIIRTLTATSCRCRSTRPPRSCITTRPPSRRPGLIPMFRPRPGPKSNPS